ncbi:unnamed protein product [Psylliodes chrysocephalus]|uniref:Uncharacterized protein n=1 Tax=Psylliodes chrysocephalus TaxID=3402493 RepID=A0A9P0CBW9_9CUCU|nr:unnamed protein product [Psylliodes chrysocephala]
MDDEGSSRMLKEITKKSLYDIMQECPSKKIDEKILFLEKKNIELTKCPDSKLGILKHTLSYFKSDFKQKWRLANYKQERFFKNSIKFVIWNTEKSNRPTKEFVESSDIRNKDVSKIIKEITLTPTRATKLRKAFSSVNKNKIKKHTPSEALAIFVEGDFTRRQREILHNANKSIYSCYSLINNAKKECYPKEQSIRVTETWAEIILQDLLNHTSLRLCKYLEEIIETCTEEEKKIMELLTKWGCDGSQQSQFKQNFENNTESDSNIFQSSLVSIRLQTNNNGQKKTIWQNPVPSSPRYCRPIRIRFIHETKDVTNNEIAYVESQARNLTETEILTATGILYINYTYPATNNGGR